MWAAYFVLGDINKLQPVWKSFVRFFLKSVLVVQCGGETHSSMFYVLVFRGLGGRGLFLFLLSPEEWPKEREGEKTAIVMQMEMPCRLFAAGNLISSSVATIQTRWNVRNAHGNEDGHEQEEECAWLRAEHVILTQVAACCCRTAQPFAANVFFPQSWDGLSWTNGQTQNTNFTYHSLKAHMDPEGPLSTHSIYK